MCNRIFRGFLTPLLLSATAAGFISGCATNPVTGTPDIVFMTEATEISIGSRNDAEVRKQYGVYDNPELQSYVQRVGQMLAAQSHRPGLTYHFTVLDTPEVNAFALPGGYIYITRGILAYLNSEAELSAVLGHEIGHVTARHAVRQYTAASTTGFVGTFIGIATGIPVTQDLFNTLGNAMLSGYGRDHELESDRLGSEYLARAGYDPQAMIKVIGVLKNQEEFEKKRAAAENRPPRIYHGVFASHPSADTRLQEVVGQADKFKTLSEPKLARGDYLAKIEKLSFGDSDKNGVRHGNHFYHRDANFTLDFPEGWMLENDARAVRAVSRDKQAILQVEIDELKKDIILAVYLNNRMQVSSLEQSGPLSGMTWLSYTGVAPSSPYFGQRKTRAAAIDYNNRRLFFQGTTKEPGSFDAIDPAFLATIRSLHALTDEEKRIANGQHVHVIQVRSDMTFASLAKTSPLSENSESILRLINDKFPDGEPQAGELIKIIQ
jgi:predicted Zn-dependent protease